MNQSFNHFLKESRINMNLSIQQLAKESSISASHISRIEKGVRNPSTQTLQALAEPLKVDYVTLLKKANLLDNKANNCIDIRAVLMDKTVVFNDHEVPDKLKNQLFQLLQNHFNTDEQIKDLG